MQAVVPAVMSVGSLAGYFTGDQLVAPVPGHPITAGLSAFTQTANHLPYGGGTKAGATVLATSSETDVAAAWTYGLGRTVYLGPLYTGEYAVDENQELIDGTIPDAAALFVQAVEWAGDYGWPSVPGFEGEYGPVIPGVQQCEGYLDTQTGADDVPSAWGDDCVDAAYDHVAVACGSSTSSYRYILVDKNPFRDGFTGYPELNRIYGAYDQDGTAWTLPANELQATGDNHPHGNTSWWVEVEGCGEGEHLTVNNVCVMEAHACFGQDLGYGDRYLWVYVAETQVEPPPSEPYDVLLVNGPDSANIVSAIEGWGYAVTTVDSTALDDSFNYSPYDVVGIPQSETVADFDHLLDANEVDGVGIVLHSPGTATLTALDLGSTTSVWQDGDLTTLIGDHFITETFGLATIDLGWTHKSYLSAPSTGVTVLGECDSGAGLAVHDTYRRVVTPFYGNVTGMPWNADGEEITRRSYRWAAGEGAQ